MQKVLTLSLMIMVLLVSCRDNSKVNINDLIVFSDPLFDSVSSISNTALERLSRQGFNAILIDAGRLRDEPALVKILDLLHYKKFFVILAVSVDSPDISNYLNYPIDGLYVKDLGRSNNAQPRIFTIKKMLEQKSKKRAQEKELWGYQAFFFVLPGVLESKPLQNLLYQQKELVYVNLLLRQAMDNTFNAINSSAEQLADYQQTLNKANGNVSLKPLFVKKLAGPSFLKQKIFFWAFQNGPLIFENRSNEGFFTDKQFLSNSDSIMAALRLRKSLSKAKIEIQSTEASIYAFTVKSKENKYLVIFNLAPVKTVWAFNKAKELEDYQTKEIFTANGRTVAVSMEPNSARIFIMR